MSREPTPAATGQVLDLSGSNTLRALLEEHQRLSESVRAMTERIANIEAVLKAVMVDAEVGTLPGFELRYSLMHRRAFVAPATDYRRLTIKKTDEI